MRPKNLSVAGAVALVCFAGVFGTPRASAQPAKHQFHHLYHALWELRNVRIELKDTKYDIREHKDKALLCVNDAINSIDALLAAAGKTIKPMTKREELRDEYLKFAHHPHLHHCIHELKQAHAQLKNSKMDFNGLRERALKDIHAAIIQLEILVHHLDLQHHLQHAFWELKDASKEVRESRYDFGVHKEKTLLAIHAAEKEIEFILVNSFNSATIAMTRPDLRTLYSKYPHHAHLHHALHELRLAHAQLKESRSDFGGHKEAALRDIHHAITQIELMLKAARKV